MRLCQRCGATLPADAHRARKYCPGGCRRPAGLTVEVQSGDLRRGLVALRDHLAGCLARVDEEKAAPLAKQLSDVLLRLDGLKEPAASKTDEVAAKRAERLRAAERA